MDGWRVTDSLASQVMNEGWGVGYGVSAITLLLL